MRCRHILLLVISWLGMGLVGCSTQSHLVLPNPTPAPVSSDAAILEQQARLLLASATTEKAKRDASDIIQMCEWTELAGNHGPTITLTERKPDSGGCTVTLTISHPMVKPARCYLNVPERLINQFFGNAKVGDTVAIKPLRGLDRPNQAADIMRLEKL